MLPVFLNKACFIGNMLVSLNDITALNECTTLQTIHTFKGTTVLGNWGIGCSKNETWSYWYEFYYFRHLSKARLGRIRRFGYREHHVQ